MTIKTLAVEAVGLDFIGPSFANWKPEDFSTLAGFLGLKIIPVMELQKRSRDKYARFAVSHIVDAQVSGSEKMREENLQVIAQFSQQRIKETAHLKGDTKAINHAFVAVCGFVIFAHGGEEKEEVIKGVKSAIGAYLTAIKKIDADLVNQEAQAIANQVSFISSYKLGKKAAEKMHSEFAEKSAMEEKAAATKH